MLEYIPMETIVSIIIVLFSIILHEVAHGYAALALGDRTAQYAGRLTLNPIKHIDPFGTVILPILMLIVTKGSFVFGWAKPVPYNPYNLRNQKWGDAIVALAGPLTNISIAVLFAALLHIFAGASFMTQAFADMAVFVVFINMILACFNLVPIPPLDGSKVLFTFLPPQYMHIRHLLERYSFIALLFFVFFLWDPFFVIVQFLVKLLLGTF